MTLRRVLVVSLVLVLFALVHAEAGVSMVALGGRAYIDASSLAAHLDAKLDRTPERLYLRTRSHVVTLTRGWARVEVDGKAVVLEAPVRVEQERWLVPEAFMRQVVPLLETRTPAPAPPPAQPAVVASAVKPAESPRPMAQPTVVRTPEPVTAAVPMVKVIEPPRPAAPAVRALEAPTVTVPLVKAVEAPVVAAPPAKALETPTVVGPPAKAVETPTVVGPPLKMVDAPRMSAPVVAKVSEPAPVAPPAVVAPAPAVRAIEAPKAPAPPVRVIEAPKAPGPAVARVTDPARAALPGTAAPAIKDAVPGAALEDLRLRSYPTFTRVVLETSAMVRHRVEVLTPKELRIRFTALSASRRAEEVRDGLIEDVQLEPTEGDAVLRVTFVGASLEPKVSTLSDPPRLLFDFPRAPEPSPRAPAARAPGPVRTLVLDAGHGGHDSGAVGPGGLMEKDLVLDVTRRVATLVEAGLPGIKVLLSRKSDYFVPLRERTSFANRERADLFVSIHANAHREAASEGVETYFLSSEASDNASRQVAAAENSVVQLEKQAPRGSRTDVVKAILWDLAQSGFQQESSRLAEVVQDSMTQSLKIPNRGVKQAGFYVLGGAAMPAILVEIGFVTNPKEERKLKDSNYRDEIAHAIFAGIAGYKQDLDRRPSRAAARQP